MARADRAAVQPALLLGRGVAVAAGRSRGRIHPGRKGLEDRLQPPDGLVVAADHQAEAALQTEDTAADADVDVVETPPLQVA